MRKAAPRSRFVRALRRVHGLTSINLGRTGKLTPLSENWGIDRGKPVDRHYIEHFLEVHASDVRGNVLEVAEDTYSRKFGGDRVTRQDILHVDIAHPRATIAGDLGDPAVLPSERFDCIILTQTLHLIFDLQNAVAQLHRSLRPDGVALITVPGISKVDTAEWKDSWYWSLTGQALRRLLLHSFDPAKVTICEYGNLYSATAFLHGAAVQETNERKLDRFDPAYPVIVAARAQA